MYIIIDINIDTDIIATTKITRVIEYFYAIRFCFELMLMW